MHGADATVERCKRTRSFSDGIDLLLLFPKACFWARDPPLVRAHPRFRAPEAKPSAPRIPGAAKVFPSECWSLLITGSHRRDIRTRSAPRIRGAEPRRAAVPSASPSFAEGVEAGLASAPHWVWAAPWLSLLLHGAARSASCSLVPL